MRKRIYKIAIIFFVTLVLIDVQKVNAIEDYEDVNVLYISSYHGSFESNPEQLAGIRSVFNEVDIRFDIEYMDTKRLYTKENYEYFYQLLAYKFDNLDPYDAIIVADDNALQFALNYQEELFTEIPIIFHSVNSVSRAKEAEKNPYMTGIVEEISLKETIDVANLFHQRANKIIAISDNTVTGQEVLESYYELADEYENLEFTDINVSDYTYAEVGEMVSQLDGQTIVLYLAMFNDKEGVVNSITENAALFNHYSSVPIYTPYASGIGKGFFGGKVVHHYEQGRLAAEMVLKVLNGKAIENIKVIYNSPNQYVFDYKLVEKYHINEGLVPTESILIRREAGFYEKYYQIIWAVIIIIIVLLLIILMLMINSSKLRQAQKELCLSNEELTATYEELSATEEELRSNYDELINSRNDVVTTKERYRLAFEASFEGLWDYNFMSNKTFMSGEWHNKFIGNKTIDNWMAIIYKEDFQRYNELLECVKKGELDRYSCEYRIIDRNNDQHWILERGVASYDESGKITRLIGAHQDITAKKEQENKIYELAYKDTLTNLPNRVFLYEKLEELFKEIKVNNRVGAVLYLDVDDFKFINDTYGHSLGDKVLVEIGNRFRSIIDENIIVCRLGGDEFTVIVDDYPDKDSISKFTRRVMELFLAPYNIDNKEFYLTVSIGVVLYPLYGNEIEDLLMNADTAMYKAKKLGKNQFVFFEKSMNEEIYDRMMILNNIRYALDNDEFVLHFQPIIDVKTKKINSFEALIRWDSKEHGLIPPNSFIEVAEETGHIVPIGNWVFRKACEFAKIYNESRKRKVTILVNVSSVQLVQVNFVKDIKEIIKETGVTPELVGIEITETAFMESFEENIIKVIILQSMGIHVSLDDFGTGYSSLSYLRKLPINTVKIDKMFVDDLLNTDSRKVLTEDIIKLAHKMGIKVVAEGVEEKEQLELLQKYGCDYIQGYLLSKPLVEEKAKMFKGI